MNILVIGGTRFFGIPMVEELIRSGHQVTIATRGNTQDSFGDAVNRILFDRTDAESIKEVLSGAYYDVIIDKIGYCSNDIKKLLDVASCKRYIYMSTTAVYQPKHMDTVEESYDPSNKELVWCDRGDFPYDEIKRQAENALWQKYGGQEKVAVRYPFVIGKDDYTKRLLFYVEHVVNQVPMFIDNVDCQMSFIRSDEAGKFIAYLVDKEFEGAINGAASGTVSIKEILDYVEQKTGKKPILDAEGDPAPYNGEVAYSINADKAEKIGFVFSNIKNWIFELIDYYIEMLN